MSRQPSPPEKPPRGNGEESVPLGETPMLRFRRLATKLLSVSHDDYVEAEKEREGSTKPEKT